MGLDDGPNEAQPEAQSPLGAAVVAAIEPQLNCPAQREKIVRVLLPDVHENVERLIDAAEQQLAERLADASTAVLPLMQSGDYTPALKQLATLKQPVDAFFDSVMVMDEDSALRDNRLALLQSLRNLFLRVADLSRLQS